MRLRAARPVSFAGTETTRPNSQFYAELEDYGDASTGKLSSGAMSRLSSGYELETIALIYTKKKIFQFQLVFLMYPFFGLKIRLLPLKNLREYVKCSFRF